jgi:hypothetical protein
MRVPDEDEGSRHKKSRVRFSREAVNALKEVKIATLSNMQSHLS